MGNKGYEIPIHDDLAAHYPSNGVVQTFCCSLHSTCSDGNCCSRNNSLVNSLTPLTNHVADLGGLNVCLDKERTFSSSSMVSEVCGGGFGPINTNTILKVALPNSKEDCSSKETLLVSDKHRPFYTNAKVEEVINCDAKTIM